MYPRHYFSLVPAFPTTNKVFVAMSFAPQFKYRWEHVIMPAIQSITLNGEPLEPFRVDQRNISDSILTEILSGIATSRLVFADITAIDESQDPPIRNANVMYEVGIAHATRLPEEVVLFRSDNVRLLFDVSNVRVNSYSPDTELQKSISTVQSAILDTVKEVDLRKNLAVENAARSLDANGIVMLRNHLTGTPVKGATSLFDLLTRKHLIELGLLSSAYEKATLDRVVAIRSASWENFCLFQITPLGVAVMQWINEQVGFTAFMKECEDSGIGIDRLEAHLKDRSWGWRRCG